mmetsp:Transcript_15134/g.16861  ORF Transcript_15134/g.16861 Transcript_15134/m.16861 type:complete len:94 (+) Transcript_15134:108-389(+)
MRQGDGILIVYDITDVKSFESVQYWLNQIEELRSDTPFILIIGNKADLEEKRVISQEQGQKIANNANAVFIETSSKNMISIDQAFTVAIKQVY